MLFNSVDFAIFFPVVFFLYWFCTAGKIRIQNILLLAASYFFYGCWDYRFLFLLLFSTALDYFSGIRMAEAKNPFNRKAWLITSVAINLGFLGVFKYYNFFVHSFEQAFSLFGHKTSFGTLNVILPVGISFYTFHGLSYVIDVYRNKITPVRNFVDYSLFVSFFPLLVAGPIERATHLLPQVQASRRFDYSTSVDGLKQILWGLFKKMVIADNCAGIADTVFNNSGHYFGASLVLGAVFFAIQIYCDFSGYSDIAIGSARLLGFDLLRNFAFPYFSRDIAEFWRRWHISLSSWFRDYLYIPLGGSKGGTWMKVRNTFAIFIVSGFWHGANWTFILWGMFNAVCFLPLLLVNKHRDNLSIVAAGKRFPTLKEFLQMIATFGQVVFGWIFFRAQDFHTAIHYFHNMISGMFHGYGYHQIATVFRDRLPVVFILLVIGFFILEWSGREQQYAIARIGYKKPRVVRWSFYYSVLFCTLYFSINSRQFIYFQF